MNFSSSLKIAAISLTAAAVSVSAQARELNYSLGLGPGSAVALAAEDYATAVEKASAGALTIRVFPLELVSLPEMGPGIRDGLTDMGYMAAPYYPAEFAHSNFLAELSMLQTTLPQTGKEDLAYAGAMSEFITTKCPECLEEFKEQNHVYMGHIASSPYVLLCNSEIKSAADLKGKRLRAGGASYKRFAEHFGAVGVQMAASEAYEALSQGVLDCAILSIPELTNFRLMEVVKSVTLGIPGNVFGGTVAGNINRDVWQSLSDEERAIMLREGTDLAAGITWNYHSANARDLEAARAEGKTIIEPDASFKQQMADFVSADNKLVAEIFNTNYGVENASKMQSEFEPLLTKLAGLVEGVDSAVALGEIYWTEIFSKLDPKSYGLN